MLHEIIARALADPSHPAASDLDRQLSYAELIDEAARLAMGLSDHGVSEGDRVALLIPNSVDFVVASLASLWVGAIFVPLAVTDPPSRLEIIVADCAPALVITSARSGHEPAASLEGVQRVPMQELREGDAAPTPVSNVTSRVAYMIYTSGTTGTPKGVQIGNAAFAAAVRSIVNALGITRTTRTLCVSPFHFDGSYANLFPTLVAGGTVIIRPREALLFPRTFFHTVEQEKVTYSGFTPSYLRVLLASPQIVSLSHSTLEMIALGGEAVSVADLRAFWSHLPSIRVFNRYGPTETTIAVTNVELTADMIEGGTVTIGQPHPGVSFVLVDDEGRVIEAAHQTGELYIGGDQLMDGYWANPELTNLVMRSDLVPDVKLYRSGDLVYLDRDGNYVYVGRTDRVVKRSGVRISLVELSASMNMIADIVAAACLTFDRDGELGIVAFVVSKVELSAMDARRAAGQLIPENMLPDRIEFVTSMPLNTSNQLDETRLLVAAGLRPFRPITAQPTLLT
ncbi:MAG: amino acid adenylation domain-containing protein [Acidimicrobiales bacterium]